MSFKVLVPVTLCILSAWAISNGGDGSAPAEASVTPAEVAATPATGKPVLNHWFALGSGCRAKDDIPGDVTVETLPADPLRPNVYRARFHLNDLKLASDANGAATPVKFARECSVRLNINPPQGKKVTRVIANTSLVEQKSAAGKVTVVSELKIGNQMLGRTETVHEQGQSLTGKEEVISLVPGTKPDEQFPELECAEPKIISFNYTWLAERSSVKDEVHVTLGGAKTLDIEAELTSCQ